MSADAIFRREHYLPLAGPRDFTDREIAAWIFALCLHRDGRIDAAVAADIVVAVGVAPLNPATLPVRTRGALACAVYIAASGAMLWPLPRLAGAFRMQIRDVFDAVQGVAAAIAAAKSADFLEGLGDVSLAVTQHMKGRP